MRVTSKPCPHCQGKVTVTVNRFHWQRYLDGYCMIQKVIPSPDVAERFLSGLCSPCWDEVIGEEEKDATC